MLNNLLTWLQVNPAASSAVTTKAGRNATVTSLMVCCGFIVCWSPNQILFFLSFVGISVDFGSWFYHITNDWFASTHYIPVSQYRQTFKHIFQLTSFPFDTVLIHLNCLKKVHCVTCVSSSNGACTFVGWFYHFTVVLVMTNSCINPFIYAAKYREFQNGVRRLVACLTRQPPPHQIQSQHDTAGSAPSQQRNYVAAQP